MIFLMQQLALNLSSAIDITSEHRTRQAPYKWIAANLLQYVNAEYLPDPHFKITEPRNMNQPVLLAFFQHIVQQQRTYDLPEVFHIKYADAGRKSTLEARDSPEVITYQVMTGHWPNHCWWACKISSKPHGAE